MANSLPDPPRFLRERESSDATREREVPRGGREPEVVIAVVIPVVVDVHATLVDREFGAIAIRERSIAHSRLRAPGVEDDHPHRGSLPSSPCILFGSNPTTCEIPPLRMSKKFLSISAHSLRRPVEEPYSGEFPLRVELRGRRDEMRREMEASSHLQERSTH